MEWVFAPNIFHRYGPRLPTLADCHTLIIWLDLVLPFGSNPANRTLIQVILTTIAGLNFIILTTLVSWIAKGRPDITEFYTMDVFIISSWFQLINGI